VVVTTFIISKNGDKNNANNMQPLLVNNANRLCCVNFLLTKYVATIYDKWIICFSLVMYTRFHTFDFCFLRGILLNIRSLLIDFNINGVYSINCQYYIVQCRSVLRRKSSWCAIGSTKSPWWSWFTKLEDNIFQHSSAETSNAEDKFFCDKYYRYMSFIYCGISCYLVSWVVGNM
jgi:hypothetical protein